MEFRCFVKNNHLVGIVQKDDTASYDFLSSQQLLETIYERIKTLVDTKVVKALAPLSCFILDVYIDIAPRHKAWVQDISPYLPGCNRLKNELFPWEDVEAISEEATNKDYEVEIRTADRDSQLRLRKDFATRFPMELQNIAQLQQLIDQEREAMEEEKKDTLAESECI